MYPADDGRYLLFASAAGVDSSPAWYWNLKASPDAKIEVGDEHLNVHAVELTGAERDAKYAEQAQRYPQYAEYQRKTTRTIPVVALFPSQPRRDVVSQLLSTSRLTGPVVHSKRRHSAIWAVT